MKLSDLIEEYIKDLFDEEESIELRRNEVASKFNCVPSQINYVIATRFIPELGFYVESRRGGGGYIKIIKKNFDSSDYAYDVTKKIGDNLSQSVVDVYLNDFIRYNILDEETANIIKVAVSDKSLSKIEQPTKDKVRADIFKNLIINIV